MFTPQDPDEGFDPPEHPWNFIKLSSSCFLTTVHGIPRYIMLWSQIRETLRGLFGLWHVNEIATLLPYKIKEKTFQS